MKQSNFYDIIPSTCSLKFIIHVKIKNQFQKIFSKIVCNFQLTVKLHESFLLNEVRVNPLYFNQIYETGLERKFVRSLLFILFSIFCLVSTYASLRLLCRNIRTSFLKILGAFCGDTMAHSSNRISSFFAV